MNRIRAILCGLAALAVAANAQNVDQQSWKIEPGEMSAKQAGKIATQFGKKLGLKDLDIKEYHCFARSTHGDDCKAHREWLFYKNNDQTDYQFSVETRTGEFRQFMNWKLVKRRSTDLKKEDLGAFAQTRTAFNAHVMSYVKLLNLPEPLALQLFSRYGHDGRLKYSFSLTGAHYDRKGRYYSLQFDPQTGKLASLSIQNNRDREWSIKIPKGEPKRQAQAVKTAIAFAEKAGLGKGDPEDILVNYDAYNAKHPVFGVGHPLWSATIDARTMAFRGLSVRNVTDFFEKGDKPCVKSAAEAVPLVHRYGRLLGLDKSSLKVTIKNGTEECYGWVGWINGEYQKNGKAVARIRLDLYQGALLLIVYDPAGLPKPVPLHPRPAGNASLTDSATRPLPARR